MEDKRFAHIINDPKFRRIPKGERKVKIDKRFQSMFKDKKFKVKYTTDKRGRPVNHTSNEDLKRYYELSSSSSEEDTDNDEENQDETVEEKSELNIVDKSDKKLPDAVKKKLRNLNVDYARGESNLYSESSSDDEEESEGDEASESEDIEHKWGELDADAESTEEATSRLAACNMDWDRIRAVDLMILFNSFLPPGGSIKSVVIYPSEFGKKRLQEEEVKGPIELVESKKLDEDEADTEEGSKYHMEKLRQYQLNRLKYYYAVISFDSAESANKVYTECDGMEYESSATKIDLRFIPDDMTFDDEPKEMCEKLPEPSKYAPRFFTTTALQQAKVDLTWDETDPNRVEITEKINSGKLEDLSEENLKNYLASSSGSDSEEEAQVSDKDEDEDDQKSSLDKYKALLQEIEDKEKEKKQRDVEMEVSWGIDLKEKTEKLVKKKLEANEEKTPFQQYLDKKKAKRKEKLEQKKLAKKAEQSDADSDIPSDIDMNDPYFAEEFNNPEFKKPKKNKAKQIDAESDSNENAELALLLDDDDESDRKHFNLKKIQENENESKSKKKRKQKNKDKDVTNEDNFEVNVNDDRFSALFTSHHYNIDPTDPHYKKTKAMETLIQEKLKRRTKNEDNDEKQSKKPKLSEKPKRDAELSLLVKSVKRKAQALKNK